MKNNYSSPFAVALKGILVNHSDAEEKTHNKKNTKGNRISSAPQFGSYNNIRAIDHTKEDSIDLINISVDGKTEIGKILSMEYVDFTAGASKTKINYFIHPFLGKFSSIYNFAVYLRSKTADDSIRFMHTRHLGSYVNSNPFLFNTSVKNEIALIAYACWYKIYNNQEYIRLLTESTLPFDSYRTAITNAVIDGVGTQLIKFLHTPRSSFIVMVSGVIRDYLLANQDREALPPPDFEFLRECDEGNIYARYAVISSVEKPKAPEDNDSVESSSDDDIQDINGNVADLTFHTEPDSGNDYSEEEVMTALINIFDTSPTTEEEPGKNN